MGRKGYWQRKAPAAVGGRTSTRARPPAALPALNRAVSLLRASLRGDTPCSAAHWLECKSAKIAPRDWTQRRVALRPLLPALLPLLPPALGPLAWLDRISATHLLKSLAMKLFPKVV